MVARCFVFNNNLSHSEIMNLTH